MDDAVRERIRDALYAQRDEGYRALQIRTIPTVRPETILGVRTPALRRMAKELGRGPDAAAFLSELPHGYFEENQLHAFLISEMRDYAACVAALEAFLPHVDNWATCDQMIPKTFRRHRMELRGRAEAWLASGRTYTVRFAIKTLMDHFLGEDFDPACLELVAAVRSGEYYVNMMVAWYVATALAARYEAALPLLEERRLAPWTHNKAIQKAVESYRISPERKAYLKTLRTARCVK